MPMGTRPAARVDVRGPLEEPALPDPFAMPAVAPAAQPDVVPAEEWGLSAPRGEDDLPLVLGVASLLEEAPSSEGPEDWFVPPKGSDPPEKK